MKGMCWQKLRGLQDAGFLYISLKRSLPPIFDIYLQLLPTYSFHNLRQTLLFKYSDFWWFYGQLKLWATKTMVQCIPCIPTGESNGKECRRQFHVGVALRLAPRWIASAIQRCTDGRANVNSPKNDQLWQYYRTWRFFFPSVDAPAKHYENHEIRLRRLNCCAAGHERLHRFL